MPLFLDYSYVQYAFGKKDDTTLYDRTLERGLRLLASKFVADQLLKKNKDVYSHATDYLKKAHPLLVKWLSEYQTSLKDDLDFLTPKPDVFYGSKEHAYFVQQVNDLTRNEITAGYTLATDLMNYYYESGAFLTTKANKDAHKYDAFFDVDNPALNLTEDLKQNLRRQKANLEQIYPTREQLKTAYRDYVCRNDCKGYEAGVFDSMTKAEKRAVINENTAEAFYNNFARKYRENFGMKNCSNEERQLAYARRNHGYFDGPESQYKSIQAERDYFGVGLDKENFKEAIETIRALQDLHDSRPAWQRFFGYFGQVGKENALIDEMKRDLIRRGVQAFQLNDILESGGVYEENFIQTLPTKEERISYENSGRINKIKDLLSIESADELHCQVVRNEEEEKYVYFGYTATDVEHNHPVILSQEDLDLLAPVEVKKEMDKPERNPGNREMAEDFLNMIEANEHVNDSLYSEEEVEGDAPEDTYDDYKTEVVKNAVEKRQAVDLVLNGNDEEEIVEVHGEVDDVEEFNLDEDLKKEDVKEL